MVQYLNIHTHHRTNHPNELAVLSLSVGHDELLQSDKSIAVGIHPWFARETWREDLKTVEEWASKPQVKMIGECGLDKLKGQPLDEQIELFEAQLEIARKVQKPVIIHCVKAYDELIASYKKVAPGVKLVIHGFNKKYELGEQLIHQGFLLSFGKAILQEGGAQELVKNRDDFFLETDDSDHPIEELYLAAANLKKCSVDEVKALIFENWKKLKLL